MAFKQGYYSIFVDSCAKYSSNIAVRWYDKHDYKTYTYSELYGVCEYLSQNLCLLNCKKGIIGLITERNILIPCIIAAAHKCSTTFMFLDPSQDIRPVINQFNINTIIAMGCNEYPEISAILGRSPAMSLTVFDIHISIYDCHLTNTCKNRFLDDHSFICMTSGSTGEQKHIQVPLQCIQPNVDDLTKLFNITQDDIIYFSTPLTFDPAMIEIQLACMNGASLLIAPENLNVLFPENRKHSITFWQTTPSRFFQHSTANIKRKILCPNSTLRSLALGGEPLYGIKQLKAMKHTLNKTKIYTLYGVTEMSCWACVTELELDQMDENKEVPLGNCLSETKMHIKQLKNDKKYGKIILSSESRKCIVLNKPSWQKSTSNCVDTGDLGEIRNNKVYFRGRQDDIIKRFGHKVDMKQIESTVMRCPEIITCSCVWLPKPLILVVYFTSETVKSKDLLIFLKCKLDDKHWPDRVIRVEALPINLHGKVSKQTLVSFFQQSQTNKECTNLTLHNIKDFIMERLKNILDYKLTYEMVKDKDFFSIGGTSFLSVSMCNLISLEHPPLSKVLLPLLLSPNNSIKSIIQQAEKALKDNVRKKIKRKNILLSVTEDQLVGSKKSSRSVIGDATTPATAASPAAPAAVVSASSSESTLSSIEFNVSWSYNTGKCVDASPTLFPTEMKTYVAVGSHSGQIVVMDALSGVLTGLLEGFGRVEAGVCCYQSSDKSARGVVGTYDGNIVCFTLDGGVVSWQLNVQHMIKSKATFCKGCVYVGTYRGYVHCINDASGILMKSINISTHPISADLVLAKNEYVLQCSLSGDCVCLHSATNTILWREKHGSPVFSNPVVYDNDKYVIFTEVSGTIYCRTVEKGLTVWQYEGAKGNIFSSMYLKQMGKSVWHMIFGCHDNKVYCVMIEKYKPSLLWCTDLPSQVYCTPCGIDDKLMLSASSDGCLCVLNSTNGDIVYKYELPNKTFSSPVLHNGCIYIGCRDDCVYSLQYNITVRG